MTWPDLNRIGLEPRLPDDARLALLEPEEQQAALALLREEGLSFNAEELASPVLATLGVFMGEALTGTLIVEHAPAKSSLLLRAMAVRTPHRGRGLGRALVEASLGLGRALGLGYAGAGCALDAHAVQTWLERVGFRLFSIVPDDVRPSPSGVRLFFRARYVRMLVPPGAIVWPRPEALTPRATALIARLWGDPPSA